MRERTFLAAPSCGIATECSGAGLIGGELLHYVVNESLRAPLTRGSVVDRRTKPASGTLRNKARAFTH